jgi:hypothetical protein
MNEKDDRAIAAKQSVEKRLETGGFEPPSIACINEKPLVVLDRHGHDLLS